MDYAPKVWAAAAGGDEQEGRTGWVAWEFGGMGLGSGMSVMIPKAAAWLPVSGRWRSRGPVQPARPPAPLDDDLSRTWRRAPGPRQLLILAPN